MEFKFKEVKELGEKIQFFENLSTKLQQEIQIYSK